MPLPFIFFFLMMFQTFQVVLMPISFGLLFSLMLLYWGQAAMFSYTKYIKSTRTLFFLCITTLTLLLICRFLDSGHLPLSNLYESLLFLSWSFLVIQFFLQINSYTVKSFTSPLGKKDTVNKEQYTFKAVTNKSISTSDFDTSKVSQADPPELLQEQFTHFVGVITSPMSLLTYSFAFLNLPKEMQKSTSLVPALQSNWLMMHVTVMILSYAALLCGSVFSMAFLFLKFLESRNLENQQILPILDTQIEKNRFSEKNKKRFAFLPLQNFFNNENKLNLTRSQLSFGAVTDFTTKRDFDDSWNTGPQSEALQNKMHDTEEEPIVKDLTSSSLSLAEKLDNYSYRVLSLGFPLLTVGILSGAVWANQAWGSYWSWDPKESWALITWLVFAIYLHARITKGWSGEKPAIIATLGFFVVWFCYLGVNLLGAGLHSYGWFSK